MLHDNSWACVLSLRIFKLLLKIVEHILKYVTHRMLSTVLKYVLRIFELLDPGVNTYTNTKNHLHTNFKLKPWSWCRPEPQLVFIHGNLRGISIGVNTKPLGVKNQVEMGAVDWTGDSPVSTPVVTPVLTLTWCFLASGEHHPQTPGVAATLVSTLVLTTGLNTWHGV